MCKKFIFQRPSAMAKSFVKLSRGPTKKESKTTEKLIPSHSNNQMGRQVNVPNDPASCVMVWAAGSNHLLPSVERNKKQVSADLSSKNFQPQAPHGNTGGPVSGSTLSPQRPAARRFHV
jgi:hypothetical protein